MNTNERASSGIIDPVQRALSLLTTAARVSPPLREAVVVVEAEVRSMETVIAYLDDQIDRLARFIMDEIEGEPSEDEGAVDTAIRLLRAGLGNGSTGTAS